MPRNRPMIAYGDFSGGLNIDTAPNNLADNELMKADNIILSERGSASQRLGTEPFNSISYAAQVEQIIEWPRNDGSKVLLAIIGTTLCKIAEDGTSTSLQVLANSKVGYFFLQDKLYFCDQNEYYVYDGTTVSAVTPNAATDNDLTPIKRCKYFLYNPKNYRIFAAGDSQDKAALYYSEPNDPTYFKEVSKLYPTTADGPIKGLKVYSNATIVSYQNSKWAWKGIDPATDAEWEKLPVSQGTLSHDTMELTPNSLTFLGDGGIYSISPSLINYNIVILTGDQLVVNRTKNKVTKIINSIVNKENTCAVFDRKNELYMLAYGDDDLSTRNNKILVLDWNLQAFTVFTGLQVNDFCQRANGDILIASNNYILKMHTGLNDWDVENHTYKAIDMNVHSKGWDLSLPVHRKKLRRALLAAAQYNAEISSIDMTVIADYTSKEYQNISLDESFTWGESWGNVWGWDDLIEKEIRLSGLKGKRVQCQFRNNRMNETATLYGIAFEFDVMQPRGVKVDG
jgi:hypothetical protein